jgi:hypothetical protein
MMAARILSGFRRIESNKTVDVAATPHRVAIDNLHREGRYKESVCDLGQWFGGIKFRYKAGPIPDDDQKNHDAGRNPGRCNRDALAELPTSARTAVDVLCHLRRTRRSAIIRKADIPWPDEITTESAVPAITADYIFRSIWSGCRLGIAFLPAAPAYPEHPRRRSLPTGAPLEPPRGPLYARD